MILTLRKFHFFDNQQPIYFCAGVVKHSFIHKTNRIHPKPVCPWHVFLQKSLQDDKAKAYAVTDVPREIAPSEPYWLPVRSVRQSILDDPYLLPSENQYFLPPDKKCYGRARKTRFPYRSVDDFEPRPDSRTSREPYWVPVNSPYFRRYEDLLRAPDVEQLAPYKRNMSVLAVPDSDEPTLSRKSVNFRRALDPVDIPLSDTDSLRVNLELTSSVVICCSRQVKLQSRLLLNAFRIVLVALY